MKTLLGILVIMCAVIPLSFYNGVVVADAWNWFIKDLLNLSSITSLQGWGIMLFIGATQIFSASQKAHEAHAARTASGGNEVDAAIMRFITLYLGFFLTLLLTHGYMYLLHYLFW